MAKQSYRDDALKTRLAAQTHLRKLRAERLSRRSGVANKAPSSAADDQGDFVIDEDLLFSRSSTASASDGTVDDTEDVGAETPEEHDNEGVLDDEPEADNETAEDVVTCVDEATEESAAPPQQCDLVTEVDDAQAIQESFQSAEKSDLSTLPGAGDGMVWMFQQCGISCLDDLAKADAEELSGHLGVIGRILNIEPWIDFAKTRTS